VSLSLSFFSFMISPPPTSTLFPYTTLFRSLLVDRRRHGGIADVRVDLHEEIPPDDHRFEFRVIDVRRNNGATAGHLVADKLRRRSEEHTSELQSLTNLVCRLLLEKKKKH